MSFKIIGLIYFGDLEGLSEATQLSFQIILATWHCLLMMTSGILLFKKREYTFLGRLVFSIIFAHSLAKTLSNILYMYCLQNLENDQASTAFNIFELVGIVTYYCMYDIVLFSWVEVVFRVSHLGYGEEKVHKWRNIFCIFTACWILAIFIISDLVINKDQEIAIKVFGFGLVSVTIFSFILSMAFLFYWIRLHKLIKSIPINSVGSTKSQFLGKFAVLSFIFIICLDVKIVHYALNIHDPFSSDIWDLYAFNYLPEAIAVTTALVFFMGSKTNMELEQEREYSETERANIKRRQEKQLLLNGASATSDESISI
ncbi:hypothetical protein CYY_009218 [Polysphondylium violaceum]|uniref:THH1/TOM1/TOM3 domain-containing protein n=1 Tax=Polysphondylium violaceum TaxID=133409 RepID=A0A8J4UWD1_9MYCE|nr:hypothetical protein CYY_009218 [Polysphondylium violaceum]